MLHWWGAFERGWGAFERGWGVVRGRKVRVELEEGDAGDIMFYLLICFKIIDSLIIEHCGSVSSKISGKMLCKSRIFY